jgi:DNA-binding NarL/FixJ family response regulator
LDDSGTILLVEDNPNDVELILGALREWRLAEQIFVVRGGEEARQQIRADPALKTTPVMMLISSREERDLLKSYEHGARACVVKPIGFRAFVETIKDVGLLWGVTNELPSQAEREF